ncbi:MAG: radical SAM protein, partial [Acidobacteria bacterium]|nr:radical SAM protein [Acidobacteriota bacterium]
MIVKLAAPCNLNCSYCYVYHHEDRGFRSRPALMSDEVFNRTLIAARNYCDRRPGHRLSIAFHGGEPTLIGIERFNKIALTAKRVLGRRLSEIYVQTNGTRINLMWAEMFRRRRVQVGISIDGPADIHDRFRVD